MSDAAIHPAELDRDQQQRHLHSSSTCPFEADKASVWHAGSAVALHSGQGRDGDGDGNLMAMGGSPIEMAFFDYMIKC